ncbi:MFS transporter [Phenylobacterium sp.]|uniref:MFS transporter n=1 Tax=Phenylobacterium sp. TaxID=1871053 RepID=UPI002E37DF66|nr:MFS transporter [Phenylobacterium sp.]HEX3364631.1 MFS transporter [Phenylobacterium sp.]
MFQLNEQSFYDKSEGTMLGVGADVRAAELGFSWRSEPYAWFVVAVLTVASTLSMADRMLLVLLVEPIKHDLLLSDTQISLLQGFAFTLLYATCGLLLGQAADRSNRRFIMAASIFGWSLATAGCGFAGSFAQLFVGRVSVGVGEAGLAPAATSTIMDYFPPQRAARPIACVSLGSVAGNGMALILGALLIQTIHTMGPFSIPGLVTLRPWQSIFALAGALGIVYSGLFFFVKEAPRHTNRSLEAERPETAPRDSLLVFLRRRWRLVGSQLLGVCLISLLVLALHSWLPTLFVRRFGSTAAAAGYAYGLAVLFGSLGGVIVAGFLGDALVSRGIRGVQHKIMTSAAILGFVPAIAAPLMHTMLASVLVAAVANFFFAMIFPLSTVSLQLITPNHLRGQIYAVYIMMSSIIAYACGPTIVALFTDYVFKSPSQIHLSIVCTVALVGPLGAFLINISRKEYVRVAPTVAKDPVVLEAT